MRRASKYAPRTGRSPKRFADILKDLPAPQLTEDKPQRTNGRSKHMSSINQVALTGRLTGDPESIADGKGVRFSLAVDDGYKNKDGGWVDQTSFIEVTFWGPSGKAIQEYVKKGHMLGVTGKLKQDRWESDGQKRSKVTVAGFGFSFLEPKKDGDNKRGSGGNDDDLPFN